MTRYRNSEYTLTARKLKNGYGWYYYLYVDGKRKLYSTNIGYKSVKDKVKSRREAVAYCDQLLNVGKLGVNDKALTLRQWVESSHFWDWSKSKYIRGRLARSDADKPGITQSYVKTGERITRLNILPVHGEKPITTITPQDCENLLFLWAGEVSYKTVNNRRSIYSVMLEEAERMNIIPSNPWRNVPEFTAKKNPYGAVTVPDVLKIISPEGVDLSKQSTNIYYHAVKLALMAGLRIGEVRGLYTDDIIDTKIEYKGEYISMSYLHVTRQYSDITKGRELVKDKDSRDIPITAQLREELQQFLTGSDRYLFSFHPQQKTPLAANTLNRWLYARMEAVGVDRKEKRVVFHSTRRFFTSLLRLSGVPDAVIQKFTGHNSVQMLEHYTDYLPEHMKYIEQAQEKIFKK